MVYRQGSMSSEQRFSAAEGASMGMPPETPDEIPAPPSETIEEVEPVEPPRPQTNASDMEDLFEVPEEDDPDIYSDDLVELDVEDVMGGDSDMSDLTSVSREDVMGRPPRHRRRRASPPPSMGGVNI